MKKTQSGFTLIELLVVIAIIGILATIVLTSLGSARTKATDAKVQAQLSSMRAQAELFYSGSVPGNYGTATMSIDCSGGSIFLAGTNTLWNLLDAIPSGYGKGCFTYPQAATGTASRWAVMATSLSAPAAWCVDSSGQSKVYTTVSPPDPVDALCQ